MASWDNFSDFTAWYNWLASQMTRAVCRMTVNGRPEKEVRAVQGRWEAWMQRQVGTEMNWWSHNVIDANWRQTRAM